MSEPFDNQDKGWMSYFLRVREKKVPRENTLCFASDVLDKIEERARPVSRPAFAWPRLVPVLVPVFAALVLGLVIALRPPIPEPGIAGVQPAMDAMNDVMIAMDEDILEDIEILRELGEWSDEDEGNGEDAAEDLAVLEPEVS